MDLQQRPGEPEAAGVPLRHEEVRQSGALEPDVPEVQRLDSGSGEGQASVWTGIGGGHGPSAHVNNKTCPSFSRWRKGLISSISNRTNSNS